MNRVSFVLALALLAGGCAKQYSVTMGFQPPAEAHYVVIQAKPSGAMKVYDCLSSPDGNNWDPTCVRADMRENAP